MKAVKVFRYVEALDGFVVRKEYREIADALGLSEWNPVLSDSTILNRVLLEESLKNQELVEETCAYL